MLKKLKQVAKCLLIYDTDVYVNNQSTCLTEFYLLERNLQKYCILISYILVFLYVLLKKKKQGIENF